MKKIEEQLKKELKANAPSNFERVWARCDTQQRETELVTQTTCGERVISWTKIRKTIAIALSACLLFTVYICSFFGGERLFGEPLRFTQGYFLIDVNPSIAVSYDEKGRVTAVEGLNEDGKVLLVGVSLLGKNYDEAAEFLLNRCVSMGYFSTQRADNALLTTAISDNGKKDEKMTASLKKKIAGSFSKNNLRGVVITGVSSPALQEEGKKYGVDAQKYGLILSYLAMGGELNESDYATISIRELYARIENKTQEEKEQRAEEAKNVLKRFETELCETLSEQIDRLVETLNVFLETDNESILSHLQSYVGELQNVKTQRQRKAVMEKIFAELETLKAAEDDYFYKELIESAKLAISVTYDFFERAFYNVLKISATPEQLSAVRLYKFENYNQQTESYDVSAWQSEQEKTVSLHWYELKNKWQKDRENDF